jgi:hypothetical protein
MVKLSAIEGEATLPIYVDAYYIVCSSLTLALRCLTVQTIHKHPLSPCLLCCLAIESNAKIHQAQSVLTFIGVRFNRCRLDVRSDAVARRRRHHVTRALNYCHSTFVRQRFGNMRCGARKLRLPCPQRDIKPPTTNQRFPGRDDEKCGMRCGWMESPTSQRQPCSYSTENEQCCVCLMWKFLITSWKI